MEQYSLGLVSVSFREHTPKEILEATRAAGLSCIEWGSDVHAPQDAPDRLREIADLQKAYGIRCSSYGTYFKFGKTALCELENYIRAARVLGTDVLRLWCGRKSGADMTAEERDTLIEECCEAARIAEKNGVTLCMECHQKTFTERLEDALYLMKAVHSSRFKMYWQPFREKNVDENLAYAKKIAPYAAHLHVFNWRGEEKLPLEGAIEDWRAYLSAFSMPRTLLLEFMPNDSLEELAAETAALRRIIGEL